MTTEHRDVLGTLINVGDYVAIQHGMMQIAIVTELGPSMISYRVLSMRAEERIAQQYSQNTIIVNSSKLSFYLLQNTK